MLAKASTKLLLAITGFFAFTLATNAFAAQATTQPWTDTNFTEVSKVAVDHGKYWNGIATSSLENEGRVIETGGGDIAWQYERIARFADIMSDCSLMIRGAEFGTAFVNQKNDRVYALANLLTIYRTTVKSRTDMVRDGFKLMRDKSKVADIRGSADSLLKALDKFETEFLEIRIAQLEEIQKSVGAPPEGPR